MGTPFIGKRFRILTPGTASMGNISIYQDFPGFQVHHI